MVKYELPINAIVLIFGAFVSLTMGIIYRTYRNQNLR
jgi:hypothetical protein